MRPQVHMLSTMSDLTDKQLEKIMDVLDCTKCIADPKRQLYYFMNKAVDEAK